MERRLAGRARRDALRGRGLILALGTDRGGKRRLGEGNRGIESVEVSVPARVKEHEQKDFAILDERRARHRWILIQSNLNDK